MNKRWSQKRRSAKMNYRKSRKLYLFEFKKNFLLRRLTSFEKIDPTLYLAKLAKINQLFKEGHA